jgi:hypothetical protein
VYVSLEVIERLAELTIVATECLILEITQQSRYSRTQARSLDYAPSRFPCALALTSPACTRSRIMTASNSANTPHIASTALPALGCCYQTSKHRGQPSILVVTLGRPRGGDSLASYGAALIFASIRRMRRFQNLSSRLIALAATGSPD